MKNSKHTIDFLFPIVLFFVFSCAALFVLLFSANTYEKVVARSNDNFQSGTALSYISQKIRQSDSNANIELSSLDGIDALTIIEKHNESLYKTYIYEYDGTLRELFIQNGVNASPRTGSIIIDITDFKMEKLNDDLYRFTCINSNGIQDSITLGINSN